MLESLAKLSNILGSRLVGLWAFRKIWITFGKWFECELTGI